MEYDYPDFKFFIEKFFIIPEKMRQVWTQQKNITFLDDVYLVSDNTHSIAFLEIDQFNLWMIIIFARNMSYQLFPDCIGICRLNFQKDWFHKLFSWLQLKSIAFVIIQNSWNSNSQKSILFRYRLKTESYLFIVNLVNVFVPFFHNT